MQTVCSILTFLIVMVISMFCAAESPSEAINRIVDLTPNQKLMNDELFQKVKNQVFLGACYQQQEVRPANFSEAKSVRKQIEFINVIGLSERTFYYSDPLCEKQIDVLIKNHPFKVHSQVRNRYLIEMYGDPFIGVVGFTDVFAISEQGIETTAEAVDHQMGSAQLLEMPLNGVNFRRIR